MSGAEGQFEGTLLATLLRLRILLHEPPFQT